VRRMLGLLLLLMRHGTASSTSNCGSGPCLSEASRVMRLRGAGDAADGQLRLPPPPREGFLGRSSVHDVLGQGKAGVGRNVVVCGWARTIRVQGAGAFAFLELNDGSTFHNIQIVADKGIDGWSDIEANTHTHTSWRAEGVLVESPGKGQETELKATSIRLLGEVVCDATLPSLSPSGLRLTRREDRAGTGSGSVTVHGHAHCTTLWQVRVSLSCTRWQRGDCRSTSCARTRTYAGALTRMAR
jgi:hypothetical protein